MVNDLHIFKHGISGYAPQGSTGNSGSDGYSVHYSSFDSTEESQKSMVKLIEQKKVLSVNPDYSIDEEINYKIGDVIITIDSTMFVIEYDNAKKEYKLKNIGILKITSAEYESDIFDDDDLIYTFTNEYFEKNDYNYIDQGNSPLYHHRDTNDSSCYGNFIEISDRLLLKKLKKILANDDINNGPIIDGHFCTLILNFTSGLRIEKILTADNCNEPIFIDNRYLYPFGNSYDDSKWSIGKIITTYDEEINRTTSEKLRTNLKTTSSKCMCYGYIAYHINKNEYRKQIIITS